MDVMQVRRWMYQEQLPDRIEPTRTLLKEYSGVKFKNMDKHLHSVRDNAWRTLRCPSVGRWKFLSLVDRTDIVYQRVLRRLTDPRRSETLLDLGCGAGQALRQLVHDGVSPCQLYGLDLQQDFIDLGYKLFKDKRRFRGHFVVGDMLDFSDKNVAQLDGLVTMVHATSFWHLFSWHQQFAIALRLVALLRPGTTNAIIFGRQAGSSKPGPAAARPDAPYLHNRKSFQRLWDEVGRRTRTRWNVVFELLDEPLEKVSGVGSDIQSMRYAIYQMA